LLKKKRLRVEMYECSFIPLLTQWLAIQQVKLSVIWEYIKSCTLLMVFLTLIFNIIYNGASVGSNIWLAKWSSDEDNGPGNMTHSSLVCICTKSLTVCNDMLL